MNSRTRETRIIWLFIVAILLALCIPLLSDKDNSLTATRQTYDCPPNPNIPGVEYRCYPGAGYVEDTEELGRARNHRGIWCNRHPVACPNSEYIAVDPVLGDPYCSLENEIYNRNAGKQVDPNGDCPPKKRAPQTTRASIVSTTVAISPSTRPDTTRPSSSTSTTTPRKLTLAG